MPLAGPKRAESIIFSVRVLGQGLDIVVWSVKMSRDTVTGQVQLERGKWAGYKVKIRHGVQNFLLGQRRSEVRNEVGSCLSCTLGTAVI